MHSSTCPNSKATPVLKGLDLFLLKYERKLDPHIGSEGSRREAELNGITSGPSSQFTPGRNPCGLGLGAGSVQLAN